MVGILFFLIYFSLLGYFWLASLPNSTIKINEKNKLLILDIITCMTGGYLFVIINYLALSTVTDKEFYYFRMRYFFNTNYWDLGYGSDNVAWFLMGTIITLIIIFLKRQYKKLK